MWYHSTVEALLIVSIFLALTFIGETGGHRCKKQTASTLPVQIVKTTTASCIPFNSHCLGENKKCCVPELSQCSWNCTGICTKNNQCGFCFNPGKFSQSESLCCSQQLDSNSTCTCSTEGGSCQADEGCCHSGMYKCSEGKCIAHTCIPIQDVNNNWLFVENIGVDFGILNDNFGTCQCNRLPNGGSLTMIQRSFCLQQHYPTNILQPKCPHGFCTLSTKGAIHTFPSSGMYKITEIPNGINGFDKCGIYVTSGTEDQLVNAGQIVATSCSCDNIGNFSNLCSTPSPWTN